MCAGQQESTMYRTKIDVHMVSFMEMKTLAAAVAKTVTWGSDCQTNEMSSRLRQRRYNESQVQQHWCHASHRTTQKHLPVSESIDGFDASPKTGLRSSIWQVIELPLSHRLECFSGGDTVFIH